MNKTNNIGIKHTLKMKTHCRTHAFVSYKNLRGKGQAASSSG